MIDLLMILASGVVGICSAAILHFGNAWGSGTRWGTPRHWVWTLSIMLAGCGGLIGCSLILVLVNGSSPTPRFNAQYTPHLVFLAWASIVGISLVRDLRGERVRREGMPKQNRKP